MGGILHQAIAAAILTAASLAIGCGSGAPFDMVAVHGKVTYEDGSTIPADRIVVKFNPVEPKKVGKAAMAAGHAEVDPVDGTFAAVTTWKHQDGVVAGKHKVVVMAFRRLPNGMDQPNGAVPAVYQSPSTTPIELDLAYSPGDSLEIKVQKPTNSGKKR
jgi:hypothetical protein